MAGAKDDVVRRQLQVKYYVEDKGISEQEAEKLAELAAKAGEASEAKPVLKYQGRRYPKQKRSNRSEKLKQKITDRLMRRKLQSWKQKGCPARLQFLKQYRSLVQKLIPLRSPKLQHWPVKSTTLRRKSKTAKRHLSRTRRQKLIRI